MAKKQNYRSVIRARQGYAISLILLSSRFRLIWVLPIFLFSYSQLVTATEDEDLFIKVYGNHNSSSGVWEPIRERRKFASKLKEICAQAHKCYAKFDGKVGGAVFDERTLEFEDSEKYNPMQIDVLLYALKGWELPEGAPSYFYLTKGLNPRCVYYLVPNNSQAWNLKLGEHVCGIDIKEI